MRVLFVSGIDGFCHRYQVLHRAAQVKAHGGDATVRHFADPRIGEELERHDVLFLYRVPTTPAVRTTQERARALGIPVVGAIDDLIFVDDPDFLPALDHLPEDERTLWRAGVRRYRATLEGCDAFVAPTEPLRDVAASLGWNAHLHRNSVSPAELALADRARASAPAREAGATTLGYFSGTPSHDADLAVVAPALAELLATDASLRLLIVGPVALPDALAPFAARIERRPLVAWHELPAEMARADVCLAPLALERRFARAKGEIKYLEAAALGVPTVASPSAAYRHAIADGANGRLASSVAEWCAALAELARDPALRARLGRTARADLEQRFGERSRGAELMELLARIRADVRRGRRTTRAIAAAADAFDAEPPARVALEGDACPAFPVASLDDVSPPLGHGSRLVQRFRVAVAGLERVDVHAVTYGQRLDHHLRLVLRRDDGTVAAQAVLPAGEAPDRGWLALDLERPEQASRGRVYALVLEADGAGTGNALSFGATHAFWPSDAHAGAGASAGAAAGETAVAGLVGAAELDGAPLPVALVLRGFARWRDALADGRGGASVSRLAKAPSAVRARWHVPYAAEVALR